jgi:hypothetical protein
VAGLRPKEMEDRMISKMTDKVRVIVVSRRKNTSNISIKLNRSINLIKTSKIIMSSSSMFSINLKIQLDRIIHT